MKKIAIINNKFVIITKDIEFIEQNTNFYLPLIQEKIDKIIKDKRTMSCYLSKIIIQALEEVFDVDCIYNNSNSLLPEKDKLYISLKEYIKNNDTFKRKIKNNHPAIGFLNGEIAIRTKELEFEVQEKDIYLPLILKKIDEEIESSSKSIQISKIIFKALKDVFEITKIFTPPQENSVVPTNDDLYKFLTEYVRNNSKVKELMEKHLNEMQITKENRDRFYKENSEYFSYVKKQRDDYVSWLRKKGDKIYY